jgi:nonribosomal peptide synthetase DhbF
VYRATNCIEQANIMEKLKHMTTNKELEMLRLSRPQLEIWMAQHLDPANPKYNIAEYFEIRGRIDQMLFEAALRQVVNEAETLNFRFVEYSGELRQIFDPVFNWSIPTVDVSTEPDPRIAAEAWMKDDLMGPVDVTHRPLFAFALFKAASDRYFWYQRFHHIVMDGFSRAIFAQRVAEVYTGLVTCSSKDARRFASFASHLQDEKDYLESTQFKEDRKYWVERFADEAFPTSFSTSLAGAVASSHFFRETIYLSPSMLNKLSIIANSAGATWRQAIIAAVSAYAYRITGASDIILTLPVLGRIGSISRRIPGMMSNALPLQLTLHSSMTLSNLVQQVSTELRQLLRHQRYRGEDLHRDLHRSSAGRRMAGPIVNIMAFDYDLCFGGHSTTAFNLSNGPVDDLSVSVYERSDGRGLRVDLDANPALYTANDLARHHRHFQRLLFGVIAADPAQPIGSLNLLEAAECRQILLEWNATAHLVPATTLQVLFEQQVERSPDAVALVVEDTSLSYHELNVRANRLAHHLIKIGIGPECIVALALERSIETVSSILAIVKAGAAYLPLDPDYPAGRLSFMIQDAKPVCIVTNATIAARLPNHLPHLMLDDPPTRAALDQSSTKNPTDQDRIRPLTPLNSAYVIYTSGSTGAPKGVVISHTGIPSLAFSQIKHLDFTPEARLLQFVSVSFDVFLFELCLSTLSGARLILAPSEQTPPGERLAAFAARSGVTHLNLPAAALNMMSPDSLSTCPNLIVGGESSAPQVVEQWSKGRRMINAYGPTEATVCATMSEPLSGAIVPPIGRPIWNTRVYVLDTGLEPVPVGVKGELYIAGMGLARGYIGRPGLTAERFIACPFGPPGARMYRSGDLVRWQADGTLDFLGRADQQIKIRGFRIEPVEIETELAAINGIAQAVVIPREVAGETRLVAYLVAHSGEALPTMVELRAALAARLPNHMLPAAFVVLDALPLTINGKLDRRALPVPIITGQQNTYRPPGDARESLLCDLFAELTGAAEVGLDDNFFDLGGSSFAAIKLIASINKTFRCDLAVRTFFEQPTIRQLADAIVREQERCLNTSAPLMDKGDNALPVVFLFPWLGGDSPELGAFRSSFAGCVHFAMISYPDLDAMAASAFDFNAIVDACFKQIRAARYDAPVLLAGYSSGGWVAFETAQRLLRAHYRVAFLGLIDTPLGLIDTPLGPVMRRSRIIPWKAISRYLQTLRSKRSVQDVLAVVYKSFVSRFIYGLVYRLPAPIARAVLLLIITVLPSRLAHSFERRLYFALARKYLSQWSPRSLEIPTTFFQSDDPQLGSEYDFRWAKVCACLTVVPIGGDHVTILELLGDCFTRAIMSAVQRP